MRLLFEHGAQRRGKVGGDHSRTDAICDTKIVMPGLDPGIHLKKEDELLGQAWQ
jgi:hypothetical protein